MKKVLFFVLFYSLLWNISNCQLLTNPSLSTKDLELGLLNPSHLREILSKNNFECHSGITGKLNPLSIINPLIPNLEASKSEFWICKSSENSSGEFGTGIIRRLGIYDWQLNHSPQPDVIRTVIIFLNEDSIQSEKIDMFFENIKDKYVKKQNTKKYYDGDIFQVFTSKENPKIEIRTGKTWIEPAWLSTDYNISFDLLR